MAIRSGFFMSINDDRCYKTGFFAEYFASFIGNGVFPNPSSNLKVLENQDMMIKIKEGKGWINGYVVFNDSDYNLQLAPADGVLNRIDRVVLRWDLIDREIKILVKQGEFATNAVAKELQRDADAYELALADIKIGKGAISITQANITDTRLNTDLCGIVHGVVDQVDTTAIFNQFESWYAQTKDNYDADIDTWTQDKKDEFDLWYITNVNEFETRFNSWYATNTGDWDNEFELWFETIKGRLDGDVGARLTGQVLDLENNKADKTALVLVENDLDNHKLLESTQDTLGHIKLSDIPKPYVVDDTTGDSYKWGIDNGLVYLEKVVV